VSAREGGRARLDRALTYLGAIVLLAFVLVLAPLPTCGARRQQEPHRWIGLPIAEVLRELPEPVHTETYTVDGREEREHSSWSSGGSTLITVRERDGVVIEVDFRSRG
jgi:hypothetical protein